MTILSRRVEWKPDGIHYAADPRHVEILVKELGLNGKEHITAPGAKTPQVPEEENPHLDPKAATRFRTFIARCKCVAQEKPDVQCAVKEVARGMAIPRKEDMDRLVGVGKCLAAHPIYILHFSRQKDVHALHGYGDSDFAGEIHTRKREVWSVSDIMYFLGWSWCILIS